MKRSILMPLLLLIVAMIPVIANAQALNEKLKGADVIYVAPLTDFDYYAIERGAGLGQKGAYNHDGKYEFGDYLDDKANINISYEIVGLFTKEMLTAVNEQMLNQLKSVYGEDKVKPWPSEMKTKMTGLWDQKKIDCQYYIIFKRLTTNTPIDVKFFSYSDRASSIDPQILGGGDMFTINLYEKVKAGKKGKAIVKVKHRIFSGVEPITIDGDYEKSAVKLISMANENFPKLVETTIDEFISEIKGK